MRASVTPSSLPPHTASARGNVRNGERVIIAPYVSCPGWNKGPILSPLCPACMPLLMLLGLQTHALSCLILVAQNGGIECEVNRRSTKLHGQPITS